ncbi:MAG: undecaprenyl-diphosphatase UppP [Patescibacteria group bacterium]
MSIFQSIILGIVQGAGEFLPISSTAHLAIIPYFFHWNDPGLAFDVALHTGTLVALVVFFFWDWVEIIKLMLSSLKITEYKSSSYLNNKNILWLIIIATIPGAIFGFSLESKAETVFRNPLIIALALAVMGIILYLVDKYSKKTKNINNMTVKDSILIGISQAVAIIPGVSRSGATITAGLARGMNRVDAARFSFLLSAPIIFGAAVIKLPKLFSEGISLSIIVGIIFSALSGYLAIKYLLKFVEKSSYAIFFWYRVGLATLIVLFYVFR